MWKLYGLIDLGKKKIVLLANKIRHYCCHGYFDSDLFIPPNHSCVYCVLVWWVCLDFSLKSPNIITEEEEEENVKNLKKKKKKNM